MKIAYTMAKGPGDTDLVLAGLAERLCRKGVKTCGTVQINTDNPGGGRCDMDIRILPDGPIFRISQSLGRGARGCRLDSGALEAAVAHVETRLDSGAALLIVNKFGKQEAEGGGFRPVIAEAVSRGLPVLVGLNPLNRTAFLEFAGGLAVSLPACQADLMSWAQSALHPQRQAA